MRVFIRKASLWLAKLVIQMVLAAWGMVGVSTFFNGFDGLTFFGLAQVTGLLMWAAVGAATFHGTKVKDPESYGRWGSP